MGLEGSSSSGEDFIDDGAKKGKPKNKNLDAIVSDSRRGSLAPPGSSRRGSRQGSISLAGTERRGSYYGDDVSKRATVAVVVDGDKARSPSPPRRRVQRKEAKVEEWNCVAKDDFFKADEKALAAAEKKKKEAEEEAKRIEDASNSTVSISVLRKKGAERSTAWNDPHQFAAMAAAAAGSMEQLDLLSSILEQGLGPEVVDMSPEE